ncbi:MAG TPA: protein kinase [Thermoanaerobaculia bacterium]|nr:protein kinase [Thermoanaerobaculia bacterium]
MSSESIGSGRFHMRRRIGSGAFGVVYEAFDPVRNEIVAVKALRRATPEALYRFKREFRSLTDISHRNLVRLYELIAEGEQWLVSMELIRGTTFIDHVRTPAGADIGRLRTALAQLASGVIALHDAGKLHRDIKPSNVLVADDRRVVLLDFGLVMDTDTRASEESTSTSGTPAYMSPEQGGGQPLGPASDWYSVGVMLYETLTGTVPFRGSYVDVINEKRSTDVPPPSTIVPGIPEDIDTLCADLLRRDPRERPASNEILQRLGRTAPAAVLRTPSMPFIGRERQLRALREAFVASMRGTQTTVCVEGISGAGKTSLIRAFLERLRDEIPEFLVLTGRCYQRESVPYKGVDSLVDALHRYLSRLMPQELDVLLPRDIAAAEQLFPVLGDVADIVNARRRGGTAAVLDQQELRRRAFAAIRELFLRLSDRTALVLVIDDVQWGDVDSFELIADILRPPDAPPLLFITAYRPDEASASPFVRALRREFPTVDIEVGRLSLEESRQLAAELLGDSSEVATMIADESGGNPFFIDELARSFALAGDTIREAAAGRGAVDVREVLQSRLRRLESGAARMLQYVAINARPILIPALRRVFRTEDFEETLAMLAAQRLIRTRDTAEGEAVETYHDRIAEAAVALLAEDELRDMHALLAMVLEGFAGADAELLADHFLAAGMEERAAKYVLLAADHAAAAVAFDRAARLYRRAMDLSFGDRDAIRRRLGEVLANAGRGAEAAAMFLEVPPADLADELQLRRNAAQQLLFSGHVDEGLAVVRTILSSIDEPFPETRRETMLAFLKARLALKLRGIRFRERAPSEIPAEVLLRVDTCRAVALGLSSIDTMRGAVFQTRYLLYALAAGDPERIAQALMMECGYSAVPGSRTQRRTRKLTAKMHQLARRIDTPYAKAFADLAEGVTAALQGRWRDGARSLESAEQAFVEHCTGVAWELSTARLFGLRCRQFLGDMRVMAGRFPHLLRDAEDRGDRYFATNVVLFSHYVYLMDDQPVRASEQIENAIRGWSHAGFHVQHIWHLRAAVEIALYENRGTLAWTKLAQSWQAARTSLVARVQFTRMVLEDVRGRAALGGAAEAGTERERNRLIDLAGRAAKRLDAEKAPWGTALAMLLRAGQSFARGNQEEGVRGLRAAEPLLQKLDMHLHAAAARRRLGDPSGTEWMELQGIQNPEAMTRLLLP